MRRVYQNDSSLRGMAVSLIAGVGLASVLFAVLPFAHQIARSERTLELRKTSALELPPPVEETAPPPPPEVEPPPDTAPEPQLADAQPQVPVVAELESVGGVGGMLASVGDGIKSMTAAETGIEAVDTGGFEQRPEPVSQMSPVYPSDLARARIGGKVSVQVKVGEDGRVVDARVSSSTRPEFEKPALDAVRKWRFRPPTRDGAPIASYVVVPIAFNPPKP